MREPAEGVAEEVDVEGEEVEEVEAREEADGLRRPHGDGRVHLADPHDAEHDEGQELVVEEFEEITVAWETQLYDMENMSCEYIPRYIHKGLNVSRIGIGC